MHSSYVSRRLVYTEAYGLTIACERLMAAIRRKLLARPLAVAHALIKNAYYCLARLIEPRPIS